MAPSSRESPEWDRGSTNAAKEYWLGFDLSTRRQWKMQSSSTHFAVSRPARQNRRT